MAQKLECEDIYHLMKLSTWRGAVVWRERAHFHTQYLFERAYVRRFVLSLHRWLTICLSVFKHWTLVKEEWIQKRAVQAPRLVGNFILCWVEKTTSFSLYEYIFFLQDKIMSLSSFRKYDNFLSSYKPVYNTRAI